MSERAVIGIQPVFPGLNPKDLDSALLERRLNTATSLTGSILKAPLPHTQEMSPKEITVIGEEVSKSELPSRYKLALESVKLYNHWRTDPYSFDSVQDVKAFFDVMHNARPVILERLGPDAEFAQKDMGQTLVWQETQQYRLKLQTRAPTLAQVADERGIELSPRQARDADRKGTSTSLTDLLLIAWPKRPASPANPRLKALAGVLAALLISSALAAGILTQLGYIKVFAK